jgi:hypothetical protein
MKGWLRQECKEAYKMICITHPYDLYDFMADNYAEPDLPLSMLTHNDLIELCMDYVFKNGAELFMQYFEDIRRIK